MNEKKKEYKVLKIFHFVQYKTLIIMAIWRTVRAILVAGVLEWTVDLSARFY